MAWVINIFIIFLVLFFLFGCSTTPTVQQLEDREQALKGEIFSPQQKDALRKALKEHYAPKEVDESKPLTNAIVY